MGKERNVHPEGQNPESQTGIERVSGGVGNDTLAETRRPVHELMETERAPQFHDKLAGILDGVAEVTFLEEREGSNVCRITVTDKARWPEKLKELCPYFGPLLHEGIYADTQPMPEGADLEEFFVHEDIALADRMIFTAKGDHVRGFIFEEDGKKLSHRDTPSHNLLMNCIERGARNGKWGSYLYGKLLAEHPNDALISATHTPAAVKAGIRSGNREGFRTYYCGKRFTDPDAEPIPLTPLEEEIIREMESRYVAEVMDPDYGLDLDPDAQTELEPFHCFTAGEASTISWTDEHTWQGRQCPLGDVFNGIRDYVMKSGRQKEGIYGMLIRLPESMFTEK